jgi:hypothetical protein
VANRDHDGMQTSPCVWSATRLTKGTYTLCKNRQKKLRNPLLYNLTVTQVFYIVLLNFTKEDTDTWVPFYGVSKSWHNESRAGMYICY